MVSDDSFSNDASAFEHLTASASGPSGQQTAPGPAIPGSWDSGAAPRKRDLKSRLSVSDLVFRAIARAGGSVVLILMILVGAFLAFRAAQALHVAGLSFLTTQAWSPDGGGFGIAAVMVGTFLIALIAIATALPLALGTSLYISEYAPRRIQRLLITMIDLMAAIPSVIFGLWGFVLLQWQVAQVARWLSDWLYWFPPFQARGVPRENPLPGLSNFTGSSLAAGLVVGLMITPIAGAVMREAFSQAPVGEREGAYALGATRWGMIRTVVLPFSRGAMIGGMMLGLGRALGETLAVTMIISSVYAIQPHILQQGSSTISSLIATHYAESTPFAISALFAAGLALFAVTLLVNFIAAQIVARSRSGAQSEV